MFTRFFQGVVLPEKFGIDKRVMHCSDLICAGQMTQAEAEELLLEPHYDPLQQRLDRTYVANKLGWSEREFNDIMLSPPKTFRDYPNSFQAVGIVKKAVNQLRRRGVVGL